MTTKEIMQILQAIVEADEADGCSGCAFFDREDWEMPCKECKRACRDYWRRKEL